MQAGDKVKINIELKDELEGMFFEELVKETKDTVVELVRVNDCKNCESLLMCQVMGKQFPYVVEISGHLISLAEEEISLVTN